MGRQQQQTEEEKKNKRAKCELIYLCQMSKRPYSFSETDPFQIHKACYKQTGVVGSVYTDTCGPDSCEEKSTELHTKPNTGKPPRPLRLRHRLYS